MDKYWWRDLWYRALGCRLRGRHRTKMDCTECVDCGQAPT